MEGNSWTVKKELAEMVTNKSQTLRKMERKMAVMRGKRDGSIS